MNMTAFYFVLHWVCPAIVGGFLIVLTVMFVVEVYQQSNPGVSFWQRVKFWHGHREHRRLYDNVWLRPDGVCVDGEHRELDGHWRPK
jgi:hypothetical protein